MLGGGTNSLAGVDFAVVAASTDGLARPMDLGFNPRSPEQLWIVSQDENGMAVLFDVGTENHSSEFFYSLGSDHFCAAPSAIAWSDFGNFGTALAVFDLPYIFKSLDDADKVADGVPVEIRVLNNSGRSAAFRLVSETNEATLKTSRRVADMDITSFMYLCYEQGAGLVEREAVSLSSSHGEPPLSISFSGRGS